MEPGITIDSPTTKKETDEVRELALATGMEEDEIDEMIRGDKIFVAKKEGIIAGFIALRIVKDTRDLEITGLATWTNRRRSGFARALLNHAEGIAHECKSARLIARTSNDNIPALSLYQVSGFTIREVRVGSLIFHHGNKEVFGWSKIPVRDEVILEKIMIAGGQV